MTARIGRRAMARQMIAVTAGLWSLGGCAQQVSLAGAGPKVEQDRPLGSFSALALHGDVDATVTVGTPQRVTVAGRLQTLNDTEIYVERDVLHVRTPKRAGKGGEAIALTITTPSLQAITTVGAARLEVAGLHGDAFALDMTGATRTRLGGEVKALTATLAGSGQLDSTQLLAQSVEIAMTGAGRAAVTAQAALSAAIRGTGQVRYRGEPTVTHAVQGIGRVRPM